jgi:hypothetical protein
MSCNLPVLVAMSRYAQSQTTGTRMNMISRPRLEFNSNGNTEEQLVILMSHVYGDYNRRVIGLTTGFIGSHTVTHNYSVYTL